MDHASILEHFNKDAYRRRGLVCEILARTYYHVNVNSGFGDTQDNSDRRTTWYIQFSLNNIPPGLPFFQFSSKVFLRQLILFPFSLLGLTKKRLRLGDRDIDNGLDIYCREKSAVGAELPWLFGQDCLAELRSLVRRNFTGDLTYDCATLRYETRELPNNEQELRNIERTVEVLLWLEAHIKNSQRDPVRSVRRLYRLVNDKKVLDKVEWDSTPGTLPHPNYPHELSAFYTVLGQEFWTDPDYTEKDVPNWLKHISLLSTLPLEDVKAVCTYLTRQERFTDGFWEHAFKSGYIDALMRNRVFL